MVVTDAPITQPDPQAGVQVISPSAPVQLPTILRLQQRILEISLRSSHLQGQFLEMRRNSLAQLASLIEMQIGHPERPQTGPGKAVLFNQLALEEFASGSITRCFGPDFQIYEGRRLPRIPNGDLMLLSRVISVQGQRLDMQHPASIVTEYDVPEDAWFLQNSSKAPYSFLMEMALQACGFLTAYMGTSLVFPDLNYYIRNLDGESVLITYPALRGETVRCDATLLSTIISGDTIIQKFRFSLSCFGQVFYQGESTFGFFTPKAMSRQVGLDSGKETLPWLNTNPGMPLTRIDLSAPDKNLRFYQGQFGLGTGQLAFIQEALVSPYQGHFAQGYAFARKVIDPQDWFYRCHFFQDPVMPGSLGVEAIIQAMQAYAIQLNLGKSFSSPRFSLPSGRPVTWKYRGQITPSHRLMTLEIHLKEIIQQDDQVILTGDASLWADKIRIYHLKNISICIEEGIH